MLNNKEMLNLSGIDVWHNLGYKGQGESFVELESKSKHSDKVFESYHLVVPKAKSYLKSNGKKTIGNNITPDSNIIKSIQFIIDNKITVFNSSTGGTENKEVNRLFQYAINKGSFGCTSVGNVGKKGATGYAKADILISVGEGNINTKGKFYRETHSSIDKVIDFIDFAPYNRNGTSFSAPFFCGKITLLQQFFREKIGRTLSQSEMLEFIQPYIIDLGEEGHDEYYGWGFLKLPHPNNIDYTKYIEEEISLAIRDLNELHPYVKHLAEELIRKSKQQGIDILITETFRTYERQNELYSIGRTKPGNIVTNAKGGSSIHNYRLAFDFVPLVHGKAAWNRQDLFNAVGQIGKSLGLTWGGSWTSFKDYPHFQWTDGLSLGQLKTGKTPINPLEVSDWALEAWRWAVNEGINDGQGAKNNVTEEQLMTFLYRFKKTL